MSNQNSISLYSVVRLSPIKVAITWFMVIAENILLILLPLLIGYAIDGVLSKDFQPLVVFAACLFSLVVVSVIRRFYDTRVYGGIRVKLAETVAHNLRGADISAKNARLLMSRELVDFLENDLPALMTAGIQLASIVIILATFHSYFALSVLAASCAMLMVYGFCHGTFKRLNGKLNDQTEQQVHILSHKPFAALSAHLEKLKKHEIALSDTEALVYGLIFSLLFVSVLGNLWLVNMLPNPSTGDVFSILTYSLEFVDTAIMLPVTLQVLSRLDEITQRLNRNELALNDKEASYEV
ncbi:ABC transporter permease [Pseudoalteromonas luteoviolacea]|uniref:ABC transporter six-transmembrane domain-containing protein n=1 Tax=Pseudoalteromonas luteoviolacea TaxID=43657 RepID=UPI001B3A61F9|nr:ABC transporter six-transmembrane domain-containing protein [Pseudoalteromonas luteoviolacea]MBQ4876618.1 ABC transporter permease [Pseudoalteromonas luteoviolacea]MBQ4905249.1 ABC transporter permease [Pseudoalteromonas luteoviolacea]